jgi:ubiquinone/menaquinone biosynthesis C-methylase UbiE
MINTLKYYLSRSINYIKEFFASKGGSASYWTNHMVDNKTFDNAESSLHHFKWRNSQYPGYIELMPVKGHDNKIIVDYGCGPGNDLTGFSVYSSPKKLIGMDVSKSALGVASKRLALHGIKAELIQLDENNNKLPIDSESVDLVHSSGVLHHCKDLDTILGELHRILKKDGEMQIMVYNYDSLWLHLYTAYIFQIERGIYKDLDVLEAFKKTTDGPFCPISYCYKPGVFIKLVEKFGFRGKFLGASSSMTEMKFLNRRFDAISDIRLDEEHRNFLSDLSFNNRGMPLYNGNIAGINACYKFYKV